MVVPPPYGISAIDEPSIFLYSSLPIKVNFDKYGLKYFNLDYVVYHM